METALFVACWVVGPLAIWVCLRRAQSKRSNPEVAIPARLTTAVLVCTWVASVFSSPVVDNAVGDLSGSPNLATFIASETLMVLCTLLMITLVWWLIPDGHRHIIVTMLTIIGGMTFGSLGVLFSAGSGSPRYVAQSMALFKDDIESGRPLGAKALAYALVFFAYIGFTSVAASTCYAFMAHAVYRERPRAFAGFILAVAAGCCGLFYAIARGCSVVVGYGHRTVTDLNDDVSLVIGQASMLALMVGLILPYVSRRAVRRPCRAASKPCCVE
ncbi:hypothetical protein [Streptomyces sp. NPDC004528]|uniref:hypothetical protein n=1 Tax=Streptomyces sp. NPDC004528 TaxID=3154550 RepID=UPI0033B0BDFD